MMNKSRFSLCFLALLVALLGMPVALAQNVSSAMLQPLAAEASLGCGGYATMADGSCGLVGDLVLFGAGAGWRSPVSVTNTGSSPVDVICIFVPPDGEAGANDMNIPIYVNSFGSTPMVAGAKFGTLPSGNSMVWTMLYPGQYNGTLNPPAMPDQLQTGSIACRIIGPDKAALDAVTASVSILDPAEKRERPVHMIIPFVQEAKATPSWKLTIPKVQGVNFVVENVSTVYQAVTITLVDADGRFETMTTSPLAPNAIFAGTLAENFPETFRAEGETSLSVGRFGSSAHGGSIIFEGVGPIIALILPGPDPEPTQQ